MKKPRLTFRNCTRALDEQAIYQYILEHKVDFADFGPDEIESVMNIVFERGEFIGGYDQNHNLQTLTGYLIGDPANNFTEQTLLFLYITIIATAYRGSRAFLDGLIMVIKKLEQDRFEKIRMHAHVDNLSVNRLYSKFAIPTGKGVTRLGQPIIIYEASLKELNHILNPKLVARYSD